MLNMNDMVLTRQGYFMKTSTSTASKHITEIPHLAKRGFARS